MHRYFAFGGCLHSDLEFPDLSPLVGKPPDWTLRLVPTPSTVAGQTLLGKQLVGRSEIRLFRADDGSLVLKYDRFCTCWISRDGSEIDCCPDDRCVPEMTRAIVLGPAVALALHAGRTLSLHGSAVSVGPQAIAILAPKHHGKSTLALALAAAGARLMSDDIVAVDLTPTPVARPGVHSVRLWKDSAEHVAPTATARAVPGVKSTVVGLPARMLGWRRAPLSSVYVLRPVRAEPARPAAARYRLPGSSALIALASHTKLADPLIGPAEAAAKLRWVTTLARTVPIYGLDVARDFNLLPAVVAQVLEWHARPGATLAPLSAAAS